MIVTDKWSWDYPLFESYVEGLRKDVKKHPSSYVPFQAFLTPLSVITLFAIWKEGKIACPLNPKHPNIEPFLQRVKSPLFIPIFPSPQTPTDKSWDEGSLDPQQLATCLYTSGSSGTPKIACHTLSNHLFSAKGSLQMIPLTPKSLWAQTLPLYHVGGLGILFRCYLSKAKILFSSSLQRATHISLVPTQLYRLLRDKVPLPNLQSVLLGGAPLPSFHTPYPILPTYGMTEMSSQIVTNHQVHPYAQIEIREDQSIWVKGDVLFQGYLQDDHTLLKNVDARGWFETKDLGEWKNNQLFILGRQDNLFISGGENIQPEEIERVIRLDYPEEEALVVPILDEEFGARPALYLKNPSLFPQIQARLKEHLPSFKIPIKAFLLPEGSGLKPNRKWLQQQALDS
ncbi:AMP-binding protein [Rhabdochlamydiaceae symbiont of Dictyostelium giganteum]|uniref:AMP-binding protein n=1 Tax=Rhabdochlamydiaceae symbiont of Dictyostelium giganteum TaxID=3342349 RepID=UPI00384A8E0C